MGGVELELMPICWFAKVDGFAYRAAAFRPPVMFWTRKNKEEHRYYLLPGMGRSNRRRHQQFVRWAIVVGVLASALFAYLLYLLSQSH
jgi:hypothetical protein